jgi:hypothetical protein
MKPNFLFLYVAFPTLAAAEVAFAKIGTFIQSLDTLPLNSISQPSSPIYSPTYQEVEDNVSDSSFSETSSETLSETSEILQSPLTATSTKYSSGYQLASMITVSKNGKVYEQKVTTNFVAEWSLK